MPIDSSQSLKEFIHQVLANRLYPFQREWVLDQSRFKIAAKARQIGLSLCIGLEGLLDVLQKTPVFYVSRTERQSVYLLDKFYKWADFFIACGVPLKFDYRSRSECKINGVDVKSLTSNAAGDEGYTGNVYLDEFGLHENDEQIYHSLFPTITWGYKIRILSRPFGQSNKFYEIFHNEDKYKDYKRYTFDINRAIADGLPIDAEQLRRNFDEEGFRENYLCNFIDESTAYIPYSLIRSCVGDSVEGNGTRYIGVDIARRKDMTVAYVIEKLGDKFYTKRVERLHKETFENQRQFIRGLIRTENVLRGCVDATGLGMQLAESLQEEFGFIEPITFTNESKERLAVRSKRVFENRAIQIPDDTDLIGAIHSIRKEVTSSNNVRFDAERTSKGHADEFWALALALDAAENTAMPSLSFIDLETEPEPDWRGN